MHYFGVANEGLMRHGKSMGMVVISDVTHMLFNRPQMACIGDQSDYLVASLRKSGPFPDGGFVGSNRRAVPQPDSDMREAFFSLRAAGLLSRGVAATGGFMDDENFHLFRKAEHLIDDSPPGGHACSTYSQALLQTISIDDCARGIAANITVLSHLLKDVCTTVGSPLNPSPYFLCRFKDVDERDAVREHLARKRCFCPIHWDTSAMPHPSALSSVVLSIPCDSRYIETDMESVANVITLCLAQRK